MRAGGLKIFRVFEISPETLLPQRKSYTFEEQVVSSGFFLDFLRISASPHRKISEKYDASGQREQNNFSMAAWRQSKICSVRVKNLLKIESVGRW